MAIKQEPTTIDNNNWFYDEEEGVSIMHRVYHKGRYDGTETILIPWKLLLQSVQRKFPKNSFPE